MIRRKINFLHACVERILSFITAKHDVSFLHSMRFGLRKKLRSHQSLPMLFSGAKGN